MVKSILLCQTRFEKCAAYSETKLLLNRNVAEIQLHSNYEPIPGKCQHLSGFDGIAGNMSVDRFRLL